MRIFAVGPQAEGVIAIGQEATGVFAFGQFATGFVAVGQVARGFIAVGQLALGVFVVGQLALGLSFCMAMLGAGGRSRGIVLPLVPVPPRKKKLPELRDLAHVRNKGSAWVQGSLRRGSGTTILAHVGEETFPVVVSPDLYLAAYGMATQGTPLLLELTAGDRRTYRLRAMKKNVITAPLWRGLAVVQLLLLLVAAWGYVQFFVIDFGDILLRLVRDASTQGITLL